MRWYLQKGNDAGFLKSELPQSWKDHLSQFGGYVAEIQAQAEKGEYTTGSVSPANRAQAIMLSLDEPPPGYNPMRLNEELSRVVSEQGGRYADVFPEFQAHH